MTNGIGRDEREFSRHRGKRRHLQSLFSLGIYCCDCYCFEPTCAGKATDGKEAPAEGTALDEMPVDTRADQRMCFVRMFGAIAE